LLVGGVGGRGGFVFLLGSFGGVCVGCVGGVFLGGVGIGGVEGFWFVFVGVVGGFGVVCVGRGGA